MVVEVNPYCFKNGCDVRYNQLPFVPRGSVFILRKTISPNIRFVDYGILDNNFLILLEYEKKYYKLFISKTKKNIFWHLDWINFFYYFEPADSEFMSQKKRKTI